MILLCLSWLLLSLNQIKSHPVVDLESRIVNGLSTSQSQYPFIAALRSLQTDANGNSFMSAAWCGGSIIRKSHPAAILTAAHCIFNSTDTIIIELNTSSTQSAPKLGINAWPMLSYVIHDKFDNYLLDNDIALAFIDVDLTLRTDLYISTVTVPNLEANRDCCNTNEILQTIGYGRTSLGSDYSKTIEYTNLQFLDRTTCNTKLCQWETKKENCPWNYATTNNICAIGDLTTPCHGDSGGPLIKINTRIQVGVVSWGILCINTLPTIFTNTGLYYTWIYNKLLQFTYTPTPTITPTKVPIKSTTSFPTQFPTLHPTLYPTQRPISYPTQHPSTIPTHFPSLYPTHIPSEISTYNPTNIPSDLPTVSPIQSFVYKVPSSSPTVPPIHSPTLSPSQSPSPTRIPSISTTNPTNYKTLNPTITPRIIFNFPTFLPSQSLKPTTSNINTDLIHTPTSPPSLNPTNSTNEEIDGIKILNNQTTKLSAMNAYLIIILISSVSLCVVILLLFNKYKYYYNNNNTYNNVNEQSNKQIVDIEDIECTSIINADGTDNLIMETESNASTD